MATQTKRARIERRTLHDQLTCPPQPAMLQGHNNRDFLVVAAVLACKCSEHVRDFMEKAKPDEVHPN